MRSVRVGRCQNYFGITGELDIARLQRTVRQYDPAHFRGIVRCDRDLGHGIDVAIAADERDAIAREQHAIPLRLRPRWLMRGRPDVPGAQILDVAPLAVVVARRVVAPARDGEISVTAEPAARIRNQRRIRNVSEDANHRLRSVRSLDLPNGGLLHLARHACRVVALDILHRQAPRYTLLQHQLRGSHQRIQMESARPDLSVERVVERDDAHSDVVRHEGGYDRFP